MRQKQLYLLARGRYVNGFGMDGNRTGEVGGKFFNNVEEGAEIICREGDADITKRQLNVLALQAFYDVTVILTVVKRMVCAHGFFVQICATCFWQAYAKGNYVYPNGKRKCF